MGISSVISLDAMSGDLGAEVVVRAANACLDRQPNLELILVGDEEELQGHVTRIVSDASRLSLRNASEVVGMSEALCKPFMHSKSMSIQCVQQQI